jgi:hypothetical protein
MSLLSRMLRNWSLSPAKSATQPPCFRKDVLSGRYKDHSTTDHIKVVNPEYLGFASKAGGEWSAQPKQGMRPKLYIHDSGVNGFIASAESEEVATQIINNHRVVPLLVNALVAARKEVCQLTREGTKPRKRQAEALVAQIDAALNAARGGGVKS